MMTPKPQQSEKPTPISPQGSLGLLALGYKGVALWRSLRKSSQNPIPNKTFVWFYLLLSLPVMAQQPFKWSLERFISLNMHHQTTSKIQDPMVPSDFVVVAPGNPIYNLSGGIMGGYHFNAKWSLHIGAQFMTRGEQYTLDFYDKQGIDEFYGFVQNGEIENWSTINIRYRYQYLDVPLEMRYTFGSKRWLLSPGVGVAANIFLRADQRNTQFSPDQDHVREVNKIEDVDFRSVNFSPLLSCGIAFALTKRWRFQATPWGLYQMQSTYNHPVFAIRHWTAGVRFSAAFKFGK
jgi:hypothetical protein